MIDFSLTFNRSKLRFLQQIICFQQREIRRKFYLLARFLLLEQRFWVFFLFWFQVLSNECGELLTFLYQQFL